ncbi:MAG: hypothetical protein AB7D05_11000 [Mangrovibacterium sp.]
MEDNPELINKDPYEKGWMIRIRPGDLSELDKLMNDEAYQAMLEA